MTHFRTFDSQDEDENKNLDRVMIMMMIPFWGYWVGVNL